MKTFPVFPVWMFTTFATGMGTHSALIGIVAGLMLTVVYVLLCWALITAWEGIRR